MIVFLCNCGSGIKRLLCLNRKFFKIDGVILYEIVYIF
jgi:hypothetical protein